MDLNASLLLALTITQSFFKILKQASKVMGNCNIKTDFNAENITGKYFLNQKKIINFP